MSDDWFVPISCSKCGRFMGDFDEFEALHLLAGGAAACLCFDCSGDGGMRHDVFSGFADGDMLVICDDSGMPDLEFDVLFDELGPHMRMHVRTRARCLSSSTYLNKIGQIEVNGGMCPNCGESELRQMESEYFCPACLAQYPRGELIVIPGWILGPVRVENYGGEL